MKLGIEVISSWRTLKREGVKGEWRRRMMGSVGREEAWVKEEEEEEGGLWD